MAEKKQLNPILKLVLDIGPLVLFFAANAKFGIYAATGAFMAFQNGAVKARELRMESQKLGTTVGMYRDLAWNARYAGVSLGEVTAGMEKVNSKAAEAML